MDAARDKKERKIILIVPNLSELNNSFEITLPYIWLTCDRAINLVIHLEMTKNSKIKKYEHKNKRKEITPCMLIIPPRRKRTTTSTCSIHLLLRVD